MIQKALGAPEWFRKGAVYQINPRTFSREGTIRAITKELPYLADLGFRTIYLCPIFEEDASENRENWSTRQKASETGNPKNPYRMKDYFRIDEEYGGTVVAYFRTDLQLLYNNALRIDSFKP